MMLTSRLGLPLLAAGQAQKEVTHNEALLLLDTLTQATCDGPPMNDPPASPVLGASYLCGAAPVGRWAGQTKALATWTTHGWRFATPFEGFTVRERGSGVSWTYRSAEWARGKIVGEELAIGGKRVVGPQLPPIADVAGGSVADVELRQTVAQIISRLREHGLIAS